MLSGLRAEAEHKLDRSLPGYTVGIDIALEVGGKELV